MSAQGHFKVIALDKAFAAKWDRAKKDRNEAELLSAGRLIEAERSPLDRLGRSFQMPGKLKTL
jgi:hypothetical protein